MSRFWFFILIFFLLALPAFSQADSDEPQYDWDNYDLNMYSAGDRPFSINLGVLFPTIFSGVDSRGIGLSLGGTGSLYYDYFLSPEFYIGGEISGMFAFCRAGHSLFIIPMGVRVGYQFVYRRIEIPLTMMIGIAPQLYHEQNYFGMIIKPGAAFYWRFNSDWSFGMNTNWWFLPQWPKGGPTVMGNFLELTLSARYQF